MEAFLPQLASSNKKLFEKPAEDINIEIEDNHDGPMIEMVNCQISKTLKNVS